MQEDQCSELSETKRKRRTQRRGPDVPKAGRHWRASCFYSEFTGRFLRDSGKQCGMMGYWLSDVTLANRDEEQIVKVKVWV